MPARRRSLSLCILPALAALLAAPAALAEEPPAPFGGRGQVAFDDIAGISSHGNTHATYPIFLPLGLGAIGYGYSGVLGYAHHTEINSPNQPFGYEASADMAWLAPSLDVFVRDRLSIGGMVAFALARGKQTVRGTVAMHDPAEGAGYSLTVMPRVGYAIPLNSTFTLWPRLAIGYSGGATVYTGGDTADYRPWGDMWMGDLELGLVTRLHRYVYVRVAPDISLSVNRIASGSGRGSLSTTVELGATAGFGILLGS